jgi:hypothetical protein
MIDAAKLKEAKEHIEFARDPRTTDTVAIVEVARAVALIIEVLEKDAE